MPTLQEIENWVGGTLPAAYRAFLEEHGDDCVASDLVLLYGRASFVERNETYEVQRYCPGFVTIGDDGGGMQLLLPLTGAGVTMVGAGVLGTVPAAHVADDFSEWFAAGCPIPGDEDDEDGETPPLTKVCIYLESRPSSLKNLLMIKEHLGLSTSIGDLKRAVDSIPCSIAVGLTYAKAQVRCAKVNAIDRCLGIRLASDPSVRLPLQPRD